MEGELNMGWKDFLGGQVAAAIQAARASGHKLRGKPALALASNSMAAGSMTEALRPTAPSPVLRYWAHWAEVQGARLMWQASRE